VKGFKLHIALIALLLPCLQTAKADCLTSSLDCSDLVYQTFYGTPPLTNDTPPLVLSAPTKDWMSVLTLDGDVTLIGSSKTEEIDLTKELHVTSGLYRFQSHLNYNDTHGIESRIAKLSVDGDNQRSTVGLFNAHPNRFIASRRLIGGSIASTRDRRLDLRTEASATPLDIYLSVRSRVSVFKGKTLLSVSNYGPGWHSLDTDNFPEGSYDVSIRIEDPFLGLRREPRFFSKESLLPPAHFNSFYLDVGIAEQKEMPDLTLDQFDEGIFVRGRKAFRLGAKNGLVLDVSTNIDKALMGAEALWEDKNLQLSGGLYGSTKADFGFFGQARIDGPQDLVATVALDYLSLDNNVAGNVESLFDDDNSNITPSFLLHYPIRNYYIGIGGNYKYHFKEPGIEDSWSISPFLRTPSFNVGSYRGHIDGRLELTNDDASITARVKFRPRKGESKFGRLWGLDSIDLFEGDDEGSSLSGFVETTKRASKGIKVGEGLAKISSRLSGRDDQARLRMTGRYTHPTFVTDLYVEPRVGIPDSDKSFDFAYGARGRTSLITTPNGRWIIGENKVTTGLLLLFNKQQYFSQHVDHFSILANGTELAQASPGDRTTIALSPYKEYKIEIYGVNKKKERTRKPYLVRSITIYPGRVTPLRIVGG